MIRCLAFGYLQAMFFLVSATVAFSQSSSPPSASPGAGSALQIAQPASQPQASDQPTIPESPAPVASSEDKVLNLPRQLWHDQIGL